MMNFEKELKIFISVFKPYWRGYFSQRFKIASNYQPLITKFYKDLFDFTSGGKKLRAFLVWLGYQSSGNGQIKKILPIALAYELVHSFLLIHDDIIDQSDTRRRKPTIHKKYGTLYGDQYGISQALILGDIALLEAFNLINSSPFSQNQKLLCQKQLADTVLETCYGEALDVEYSYKSVSLNQIWLITELKTAKYTFVGPLILGAILRGARDEQLGYLAKFGLLLGKAFQLQDDFLGIFGDEKVLGKSILSDMREGKNTVLISKACQMVKGQDKKDLEQLWGNRTGRLVDLKKARKIIEDCGALRWCKREKERLAKEAKTYTKKITSDIKLRNIFNQIADFVIARES